MTGSPCAPATQIFTTGSSTTSANVSCYEDAGSGAACDDIRLTQLR